MPPGSRGSLVSTVAQAKGKITETELQIIQIDQDMRTEIGKELADIRGKTAELIEKKVAAEDQLKRVDIRAPQDGAVHELAVHTVGGVVGQGETIMLIVPKGEVLTVEVKVAPQEIDQVHLGQKAVLRFSAFNQRTTPELDGDVSRISADISQDQKAGTTYLHGPCQRGGGTDCAAERSQASTRHAGGDFHPDEPALGNHLSCQAFARPDRSRVPRKVNAAAGAQQSEVRRGLDQGGASHRPSGSEIATWFSPHYRSQILPLPRVHRSPDDADGLARLARLRSRSCIIDGEAVCCGRGRLRPVHQVAPRHGGSA